MISDSENLAGLKPSEPACSGEICEPYLRHQCPLNAEFCSQRHCSLPYQWQIFVPDGVGEAQWYDLPAQSNVDLEFAYCNPSHSEYGLQFTIGITPVYLNVLFDTLQAVCITPNMTSITPGVRRLSTQSYATDQDIAAGSGEDVDKFVTQWRWYWSSSGDWKLYGQSLSMPQQHILEAKYLHGQPIYRFEVEPGGDFIIDFRQPEQLMMKCLTTELKWLLRRRPMFLSPVAQQPLPCPPIKPVPFAASIPQHWLPVDTEQDSELIPINPSKMAFHLIASAFHESLPQTERQICDIFSIQNPFLYHKYASKRQQLQLKRHRQPQSSTKLPQLELQLFHGTSDVHAVRAICRHNFDPRICGTANDVVWGHGAYFARDARFSDRYARNPTNLSGRYWMFLARVLVGRSAVGNRAFHRPPLIDPLKPHGDLYDSCVNNLSSPSIYVIFDSDQCYPEYLISYTNS
jgi:poly [ADP-ribose] polymerase 7/11/12/13